MNWAHKEVELGQIELIEKYITKVTINNFQVLGLASS